MFHASHHISSVPATEDEVSFFTSIQFLVFLTTGMLSFLSNNLMYFYQIEAEANAVKSVTESLCPLKIVLEERPNPSPKK